MRWQLVEEVPLGLSLHPTPEWPIDFISTEAKMILAISQLSSLWFKAQPDLALLPSLPSGVSPISHSAN